MKTKPSASRIWPAVSSSAAGALPFGYSLYIRSSNRQPDRLGVDQLDLVAAAAQTLDHELREPNAHAVGPVRTVEHENAMAHGAGTLSRRGCPASPSLGLNAA
jgi:hypothetical protein